MQHRGLVVFAVVSVLVGGVSLSGLSISKKATSHTKERFCGVVKYVGDSSSTSAGWTARLQNGEALTTGDNSIPRVRRNQAYVFTTAFRGDSTSGNLIWVNSAVPVKTCFPNSKKKAKK
jgi:hypothetical protein